ncbi:hypothetical protein Pfo_024606, partial [Paulownia fortunei]
LLQRWANQSVDKLTPTNECLSYARVLVKVDAAKELVMSIHIQLPNGRIRDQQVDYEYEPKYCAGCKVLGHHTDACNVPKSFNKNKGEANLNQATYQVKGTSIDIFATGTPSGQQGNTCKEPNPDGPVVVDTLHGPTTVDTLDNQQKETSHRATTGLTYLEILQQNNPPDNSIPMHCLLHLSLDFPTQHPPLCWTHKLIV